jgi:MYND finger protein
MDVFREFVLTIHTSIMANSLNFFESVQAFEKKGFLCFSVNDPTLSRFQPTFLDIATAEKAGNQALLDRLNQYDPNKQFVAVAMIHCGDTSPMFSCIYEKDCCDTVPSLDRRYYLDGNVDKRDPARRWHVPRQCEVCGKGDQVVRCIRCRSIYYCSREHQQQNWKSHRPNCNVYSKLNLMFSSQSS